MNDIKYFSGVGSRETPESVCDLMSEICFELTTIHGYILRSGGAPGADMACEALVPTELKHIYLPWKNFNKNLSTLFTVTAQAKDISAKFHPAWKNLSHAAKLLHGRNAYQVLGDDLMTPSDFVICYTTDGCESHETRDINTGGTGTAISIASYYKIPVINMFRKHWYKKLKSIVNL